MDELDIERWEHALTQAEEQHKRVPIPYREIAYWRDLVPYKCIVQCAPENWASHLLGGRRLHGKSKREMHSGRARNL
jgi:hypothetical protein